MDIRNSKVVVTGGAGFIGSHIAESLVELGARVIVFDNFSSGRIENLSRIKDNVEIVRGDILDYPALEIVMANVDYVSHQAAQLEIFLSTENPYWDLEVNTVGTLNVLKAARKHGVKKVINASSACIYGQVDGLTAEDYYPRPNWAYGVSKLAAEKYCDIYSDYHDLPLINLRYGITYGEREWFRRVLTVFIKRSILGLSPVVFGDGAQVRDFVYVKDVVRFHNLCIEDDGANGKSFNVGTGIPTTVVQLAHEVLSASGRNDLRIEFENLSEGDYSVLVPDKRRNAAELKVMLLDVTKAKKELGWTPLTPLSQGLRNEIAWASKNLHRWEKIVYAKTD